MRPAYGEALPAVMLSMDNRPLPYNVRCLPLSLGSSIHCAWLGMQVVPQQRARGVEMESVSSLSIRVVFDMLTADPDGQKCPMPKAVGLHTALSSWPGQL